MSTLMRVKVLDPEHAYLLTLDRPNSSANILDLETMQELDERLRALSGDTGCRGLIIESAKPSIFIAGADINQIAAAKSEDELAHLVRLGQQVMNRLATFHAPTVSCIHGAALGGGFEFSLACDYRIASRDRVTQIGLPEINLGLLPCWGGCTRLPRLIGLPLALDLILHGKRLAAVTALKHGLVDELVPREHQLAFALKYIAQGKPARKSRTGFTTGTTAAKARKTMLAKTRGNYPAVDMALEVMVKGIATTTEQSLMLESRALLELARTAACRNLIRIYQMTERARKLGVRTKVPPVRQIAVIGAGVMGSALAHWISSRETRVVLKDLDADAVARGLAAAARLYHEAVKKNGLEETTARQGMDRIVPAAADVPLRIMDIIIEAVAERLELKKDVFRRMEEQTGPQTILASNTSALPITELAGCVKHPDRVIGLHFFHPVHRMQLVEIVTAPQTSPTTVERAVKFVQQMGKLPVVVRDSPGFIVNRILTPYLLHAVTLFQAGHDARAIDDTMLDFGMPVGPLRYLDESGLDTFLQVAEGLGAALGKRFSMPDQLPHMVKHGALGKKAGAGFYQYPKEGQPRPHPELRLGAAAKAAYVHPRELQRQMALLMVNEAARCLDEKVVEQPADLDFAMIMGAGFAPFRGGPLRHADEDGITEVLTDLMRFAREDSRFEPCSLLTRMATKGGTFYPEKKG